VKTNVTSFKIRTVTIKCCAVSATHGILTKNTTSTKNKVKQTYVNTARVMARVLPAAERRHRPRDFNATGQKWAELHILLLFTIFG